MSPSEIGAFLGAIVSACCSIYALVRTARWRESQDAKKLLKTLDDLNRRIGLIEARDKDLPTKADLAILSGNVKLVEGLVERCEKGIDRIESFMMRDKRP